MQIDTISADLTITTSGARNIAELMGVAAKLYGDSPALRIKRDGEWQDTSYRELEEICSEVGRGLIDLGVEHGDRVGLLCSTRAEWPHCDFGISMAGAVVVPIYPTSSPAECAWVLGNSESKVAICENAEQVAKIIEVRDQLPNLELIVSIDECDGQLSLDELRTRGRKLERHVLEERIASVKPEDVYRIMYTSGTTGPPKGSILSHGNYVAVLKMGSMARPEFKTGDAGYLYLPLAHAFALIIQLGTVDHGGVLALWTGDINLIIPEVMEIKPTSFPSVPRLYEKLYRLIASNTEASVLERATAVGTQVRELKKTGQEIPPELQQEFDQFDEMLYKNVRNLLGGSVEFLGSGGAPIAREIVDFFAAVGMPMLEGYGLTETSTVLCVNTLEDNKPGTVGRPLPGVEIRIADDGEVLARGPNIFQGYYKMEEEEGYGAIRDGWFYTGDLGSLDEDGYLTITGRKKEIIITAGGKNITPANIENEIKQSQWISQVVMYGDRKPYVVALVTLDPEQIMVFAKEHGLPEDTSLLAKDQKVIELVQKVIDEVNPNHVRPAQIKRFVILHRDFSPEDGELTPSFKVKRNVVHEQHRELFEGLYSQ